MKDTKSKENKTIVVIDEEGITIIPEDILKAVVAIVNERSVNGDSK